MIKEKNTVSAKLASKHREIRTPKIEQFIGIYPNAISKEICSNMVKWFDMLSEYGLTMSTTEDVEMTLPGISRTDELIHVPSGIPSTCFARAPVKEIWTSLLDCYKNYEKEFSILLPLTSHSFKIHRVQPTGGYHMWHHEHHYGLASDRVLAWMIVLEAPKSGGETEFLFQSMRVEPKVGQVTIWPAAFTHKHRGNPPLECRKTYATGWFVNNMMDDGRPHIAEPLPR